MKQPESSTHVDTHWTRALYHDLFAAQPEDQETYVAADRSSRVAGPQLGGSPVHTAANRLAIFIAIYTAVAVAVHFLFWPTAAASAHDGTPTAESGAASPNFSSPADPSAPGESMDPAAGRRDSPTRPPNAAAQSMSLYD